jgi:hypothetical protein
MKKKLLLAGILAAAVVIIPGCSKDDTEAPVITLLGSNPFQLEMLDTYNDPGATADDNEDGDISSSISVNDGDVENRIPGSYEVYYSVTDAAGNSADATRDVEVYASTDALATTYTVFDTCGSGASAVNFSYQQTVSKINSTTIGFNKFGDYSGNNAITATLATDGSITLPLQQALDIGSATEDHEFQGTGSVNNIKGFVINYTDKNNSANPVSTAACRAWFERN